jgi:hypothetical protein
VVKVQRCTEGGDAPGWQGATSENTGEYLNEEQRSQTGCSAGRMQLEFHHGLLAPVVKVWRRTETGEAPRRQGATTENTGSI